MKFLREQTTPLFYPLVGILFGLTLMVLLGGCATTQQSNAENLADLRDTACPLAQVVILGLQLDPTIDPKIKDQLVTAEPFVTAACSADSNVDALHAMADKAFPVVLDVVMKSPTMTPEQKQAALVALSTARIVIVKYRKKDDAFLGTGVMLSPPKPSQ